MQLIILIQKPTIVLQSFKNTYEHFSEEEKNSLKHCI